MLFGFGAFVFPSLTLFWWLESLCLHHSSQLLFASWDSLFFLALSVISPRLQFLILWADTHITSVVSSSLQACVLLVYIKCGLT